jgi:flagellar hook-length control protein FliK
MISLDLKSNSSKGSSALNLSPSDEKSTISFSDLLKGVKLQKGDDKLVQNGVLVLALDENQASPMTTKTTTNKKDSKIDSLISLLKGDETPVSKKEEALELNPKLTTMLSNKEVKTLVSDAKEYLKTKILQSDGYKSAQIKELPKTLKGLAALAKKFDIDISKITVQEVQAKDSKDIKKTLTDTPELKTQSKAQATEVKAEPKATEIKVTDIKVTDAKPEIKAPEIKAEVKTAEIKTPEAKADIKSTEAKSEIKTPEIKAPEIKAEVKTAEIKTPEAKADIKSTEVKPEIKTPEVKADIKSTEVKPEIKTPEVKADIKIKAEPKTSELSQTPIFKAQSVPEVATTTQQIVQAKTQIQSPIVQKTPKEKADETLKLLLRGEKPTNHSTMTADFSVNTAKVIAPQATTNAQQSLESLLHGDLAKGEENITLGKNDIKNTPEIDAFEVKIKEAKQMVKYISQDVKTAIEDYKSPFTRVKVQLNPKNLGEVDLTVVQRGKNLHVNISSNNAAVNTLSMNINELKVQLSNNGINNASFNFNSNSQNGEQAASQQQQNQQNERKADEEYNYFENNEANEEILNSLEIVVPQYG